MVAKKKGKTQSKNFKKNKVENKPLQKKKNFIPLVIGVVVLAVLLFLLITQFTKTKISQGDTVTLDYTLYVDGKVFDTSLQDVGVKVGLQKQTYSPLTFILGDGKLIPGFEEQVIGMNKGENKKFSLSFDKAYGPVRQELFFRGLKRDLNVTKYSIINKTSYNGLFEGEPQVGKILKYDLLPWNLKIVEVNSSTVKIENLLNVGDKVKLNSVDWSSVVTSVGDEFIIIRQDPQLGQGMALPTPIGTLVGKVIAFNETSFDVDGNHPLAGKDLIFEVNVKNVQKK